MRRAAKVDGNQTDIVDALRAAGCSVRITSAVGSGFPDIVVGRAGVTYLLEIKDGSLQPSRQKLTPDEREFANAWRGHYAVAANIDEALAAVGLGGQ